MKGPISLLTTVVLLALVVSPGRTGEMTATLSVDKAHPQVLSTMFGTYGPRPRQAILREVDGVHLRLPGGAAAIPQTGIYSYFALSGDCEITCTYELLALPTPRQGYGSGVGLAVDAGDGVGRGIIMRLIKPSGESGYTFESRLLSTGGEAPAPPHFVPTAAKVGRIGLRRVKKELVFLTADSPAAPLEEVERLPFTDGTIGAVRFFADTGGSPTALDVRVRAIQIRAEEIAAGTPQREHRARSWWWLWLVVAVAGGVPLWRLRRAHRRRADAE